MAETFIESSLTVTDLLQRLNGVKCVSLLTGTEQDSWTSTIAWDPLETFSAYECNRDDQLESFIEKNNSKGRLCIGYVSYDYGYCIQGVKKTKSNSQNLPYIFFCAYQEYVVQESDGWKVVYKNSEFLDKFKLILDSNPQTNDRKDIVFETTSTGGEYAKLFNKTKEYIKKGHIYQLNLAHNLEAASGQNARMIFSDLASNNMAKMMSYFEGPDFEIMSISPERFISTNGKHIETFPIKGTRARRNADDKNNKAIAELMTNQKELSELNMITDLLRNDLGKVCEAGSVRVEKERDIQILSNVIHTFSKIAGRLKDEISPTRALLSMFPGGSITGCPKKRAMEIIDELEPESRGIYCGCMVVIDPQKNLDSSILIRTIIKKGKKMILPVGGGIVFDSKLSHEYKETLDKATSLQRAI